MIGVSQLSISGAELPYKTTHIWAAAGLIALKLVEHFREAKLSVVGMATGAVAGLVGVTPAAVSVTITSGMIIGLITSVICYCSIKLKNHLKFDDSLDTFAVHGVGGVKLALF